MSIFSLLYKLIGTWGPTEKADYCAKLMKVVTYFLLNLLYTFKLPVRHGTCSQDSPLSYQRFGFYIFIRLWSKFELQIAQLVH